MKRELELSGIMPGSDKTRGLVGQRTAGTPAVDPPISLGERLITATISAIAAVLTLVCYDVITLVYASKSPSGPPGWLLDFFVSKTSGLIVCLGALLGFVLGGERMAKVFGVLWGTSPLWQEAWFHRMAAGAMLAIILVIAITHLVA